MYFLEIWVKPKHIANCCSRTSLKPHYQKISREEGILIGLILTHWYIFIPSCYIYMIDMLRYKLFETLSNPMVGGWSTQIYMLEYFKWKNNTSIFKLHFQPILGIARFIAIVRLTCFPRFVFHSHFLWILFPIACVND